MQTRVGVGLAAVLQEQVHETDCEKVGPVLQAEGRSDLDHPVCHSRAQTRGNAVVVQRVFQRLRRRPQKFLEDQLGWLQKVVRKLGQWMTIPRLKNERSGIAHYRDVSSGELIWTFVSSSDVRKICDWGLEERVEEEGKGEGKGEKDFWV
jgi:hypothetical protein